MKLDRRFNFYGHSNAKKIWYIDGISFESDKGTNNGKQKAVAYAREQMLDDKDIKKFDSEMEFKRYLFLKAREDKGEIQLLKDHYNFQLLPAFTSVAGIEHEELLYEADFYYYDNVRKRYVVEDVKGNLEDVFRVKWKLFDKIYYAKNLAIVCVRIRSGRGIDYLDANSWYEFSEKQTSNKRIAKIREENIRLKAEAKAREIAERKATKEKMRLAELKVKPKLTKRERERLEELMKKYGN